MHIKDVKVTNPNNVVLQIPGFVSNKWKLSKHSELEVHISEDGQAIVIRPKEMASGSATDS